MSLSNWPSVRLNRWRMDVWLASIRPLTRCALGAYGDLRDSATCQREDGCHVKLIVTKYVITSLSYAMHSSMHKWTVRACR